MRLLLTRAAQDAEGTRARLEAAGHQVLLSPVIAIAGTGAGWPRGVVDALVATSAQAFRVEIGGLPLPESCRVMPLYLVGSRTEEAARAAGFLGASIVAKTAAELAERIIDAKLERRCLVYLAGRDRKPDLEAALSESGIVPDVIEVYTAVPVDEIEPRAARALAQHTVDGILHFSRRSASLFVEAAQKSGLAIDGPAHFCLSEEVATPLREAGCGDIRIAPEPREADLLELVGPA